MKVERPAKHPCPKCHRERATISDSRASVDPLVIRRRRYHCTHCEHRFSTLEVFEGDTETTTRSQLNAQKFLTAVENAARQIWGDDNGNFNMLGGPKS